MRSLLVVAFLCLCATPAFGQHLVTLDSVSKNFTFTIDLSAPPDQTDPNNGFEGVPGKVLISRKGEAKPFQVLNLKSIQINATQLAYNPTIDTTERVLYDTEYSVVVEDFNFDGKEDLAICNGRHGGYGAPSYNVFLFNEKAGRFIRNLGLSRLTTNVYLGLFFPDSKTRRLAAYSKSGCCYHETEYYRVVNDRPVMVEKLIVDSISTDRTVTTHLKKVRGRWVKKVTREE